jgi:hypothetical protein
VYFFQVVTAIKNGILKNANVSRHRDAGQVCTVSKSIIPDPCNIIGKPNAGKALARIKCPFADAGNTIRDDYTCKT